MIRTLTAALLAAALAAPGLAGATPAKPAAKAAATPSAPAKPAPAKPAPAKPTSPIADFDARNPQSVIAILNASGGKATLVRKDEDAVLISFQSLAANFSGTFAGCDAQGRACKAVQFDSVVEQPGPSFAQMNGFNQSSALCRGYEDKAGKPHVLFSTLLFADDPYDHFRTQMQAWTGCIADFRNFLKDPNGYLASAP
ncbi:MAG: hypothetical protein JSR98_02175 [Proteobacteria bacterium]|nr:hypothetical protein [Pseudomonadota bacterium]